MNRCRGSRRDSLTRRVRLSLNSFVLLRYAYAFGATENAILDIARLDNAAPYRKGGHRETCFSVRVDAHYKFMFDTGSII